MQRPSGKNNIILSIITPYYETLEYIKELAKVLEPQLTDEVEWIIVDNGCNETELDKYNAKVIHLKENSGGPSYPRNVGLDIAQGNFITFIDSDDSVMPKYVEIILHKIKCDTFDYCYFSWKSPHLEVIIKQNPPKWNCCVWNCIYSRKLIGNERFNNNLHFAEDYDFNIRVKKGVRANIQKILYYYNDRPGSMSKTMGGVK